MKTVRTILKTLFLCALLGFQGLGHTAQKPDIPLPAPPQLASPSYLLMDHHSGVELVAENADQRMEPASLTKMMTVYAVFSELNSGDLSMEEEIRVSERAWRAEGSRMFIEVDTRVTVRELLFGVIVQSGNDASIALAETIAGDEQTFAQLMNQYAERLGMTGTHYVNATGLPHPEHYTTARDTARLARALIRDFPELYKLFAEKTYTYNDITQHNRNALLWRDPSVDGLKTGHTESAGYCLTTSAKREDMRLIAVVMGAESEDARADQNQALLNYGFRFFETHRLYAAGEALTQAEVWKGAADTVGLGLTRDLFVTIPQRRYDDLEASMSVDKMIVAPVQQGQRYGDVTVTLEGSTVATAPLVAVSAVEEGNLWQRLVDEALLLFQ
ncbi:D-alanyl-D-alanine carboxypeptidase [Ectothiorhodospiraceae bacterium WFHF3C12]|nr:D-alanyl-D-alanine carboxypeptidase [Ectothiorhodospiraceae bacterium WFHF3C12]